MIEVEANPKTNRVPRTIVIGSGPVGVRFATELFARQPNSRVTMYGDEATAPYNRVQLSSLLAGEVTLEDITLTLPQESAQFSLIPERIDSINTGRKVVETVNGETDSYDRLVLATGARAHVPNISGLDQRGVYTFRNLRDAEHLYTRTWRAQHVVVIGGGLLGVESARALLKNNTKVTLMQQAPRLLNKQLDEEAASLLASSLKELGIEVITNSGVRHIAGKGRVTGVILRNRASIDCDTVLLCSGITPNIELARSARLRVNRGVVVDDKLRTSNDVIFAIGECCEHQGQTYGVVSPGFEQAVILADNLGRELQPADEFETLGRTFAKSSRKTDGKSSDKSLGKTYGGSSLSVNLKVVDTPVISFGSVTDYKKTPFHRELVFRKNAIYRKLISHQGVLSGGVVVGEWPESNRALEAFSQHLAMLIFGALLLYMVHSSSSLSLDRRLISRFVNY